MKNPWEVKVGDGTLKDVLTKHKDWLDKKEGGVQADLSGMVLEDINLQGVDLRLSKCNYTVFSKSNLRMTMFAGVQALGVSFHNSYLPFANLDSATMLAASFRYTDLRNAKLSNADLSCAEIKQCDMTGVKFQGTVFLSADIQSVTVSDDLSVHLSATLYYASEIKIA